MKNKSSITRLTEKYRYVFYRFEVVAHYLGLNREYISMHGKKIHWPGGREGPPPDIPECGFLGNDPACTSRTETYTFVAYTSVALSVFLLAAITAACLLYRYILQDFEYFLHRPIKCET